MIGNAPGGIYLCQVSETVSCGACCGLYNVEDCSRENLAKLLNERTEAFSGVPREIDAILEFGAEITARQLQNRPFPEFHHCPFIGLIGDNQSRVGCLLHPQSRWNEGIDYRGLSEYGGMACKIYFCPSCYFLSPVIKTIIRKAADDWYLYGLVITEKELLESFFQAVEKHKKHSLSESNITINSRCIETVHTFMALKIKWPFRPQPDPGPCNYFFEDRRYAKPPIDYNTFGLQPSQYHVIFRELKSCFDSQESLERAEKHIEFLIERLASSFST